RVPASMASGTPSKAKSTATTSTTSSPAASSPPSAPGGGSAAAVESSSSPQAARPRARAAARAQPARCLRLLITGFLVGWGLGIGGVAASIRDRAAGRSAGVPAQGGDDLIEGRLVGLGRGGRGGQATQQVEGGLH